MENCGASRGFGFIYNNNNNNNNNNSSSNNLKKKKVECYMFVHDTCFCISSTKYILKLWKKSSTQMLHWNILDNNNNHNIYYYGSYTLNDISFNHVDHYKLSRKFVVNTHDV